MLCVRALYTHDHTTTAVGIEKKTKKKTIDNEKCNVSNANEHHFSSILMDLCSVESCCAMAMCMYRHGTEAHSRKNDYYVCVCVCCIVPVLPPYIISERSVPCCMYIHESIVEWMDESR